MILALVMRLFTGEAGIFLARLKRVAGLYALLGILILVVTLFLVIALFLWAASLLGGIVAALLFAGIFSVLALVIYVLAVMANRRPANKADDRLQRDIASIAGVTALSNAPQLVRALRQRKGLLIVPAAAAGFFGLYRLLNALRRY